MSVSDLALSLKRTLEESYGRVRVRGELSGLKLASSGHLYGDIKDADAARMERREIAVLRLLGIANPYRART